MEKSAIISLLEKYWRAETTVDEEKVLAEYFNGPSVDAGLEPYRALFAYFEEESRVSPGPGFEARILSAISAAAPSTAIPVRYFHRGLVSAAATVLILVASLFLLHPSKPMPPPAATAGVTDTYDDPEKALAAVRHALLIASFHLNEGRKQITNK